MRRWHAVSLLIGNVVIVLAALAAAACGDEDEQATTETTPLAESPGAIQPQPEPVQELDAALTEAVDGVIGVRARGISFKPNRLSAPLGQTVTIRVTNEDAVSHALRIAGLDGQYDTEDDAVTEPRTVPGGQSGEMSFTPAVAGDYTFRCDFHPGSMGGQVVVQ